MCIFAVNSDPKRGEEGEKFGGFFVGQNVRVISDLIPDHTYRGWIGEVWCFEDVEGMMMAAVKLLKRPDDTDAPEGDFEWFLARDDCLCAAA